MRSVKLLACLLGGAAVAAAQQCGIPPPSATATVTIDAAVKYQEVDGFGTSQAFQRAYDALGRGGLSPKNVSYVLDLMFSESKGAGFSILRNGIGSTNNSNVNYMISIERTDPGSPTAQPQYVFDRNDSGQFPLAQQAYARDLKYLYADAWSAPWFMKTNNDDFNGGYLCGVTGETCASGDWKQAYANYLVQLARFYHDNGVPVTHIGFLNEPQFVATYASMLSNGTQAADFIRVLASTIKSSGLDLKINCCDGIGWEEQNEMMPGLLAGPDPAINYVDVITGHGYSSSPDFPLDTPTKTWMTEWADLSGAFTPWTFYSTGAQGEGATWAQRIQSAFVSANVSAFVYWEGSENATSNSCLINTVVDTVYPSKRFWAFAQFSRFARPGARRIEATSDNVALNVSSFVNLDGKVATQVISYANVTYAVKLEFEGAKGARGVVQPWLTDNKHNLTALATLYPGADGSFVGEVPGRSLVSFVLQ
jgi:O-glycosyl hydrolase